MKKLIVLVLLITLCFPSISLAYTLNPDGSYTLTKDEMMKLYKDDEKKEIEIRKLNAKLEVYRDDAENAKKDEVIKQADEVITAQKEVIGSQKIEIGNLDSIIQTKDERIANFKSENLKLQRLNNHNSFLAWSGWGVALITLAVAISK